MTLFIKNEVSKIQHLTVYNKRFRTGGTSSVKLDQGLRILSRTTLEQLLMFGYFSDNVIKHTGILNDLTFLL